MDDGMISLRDSLSHNPSSEAVLFCRSQVKVGGTLIERSFFHAGLISFLRTLICFANSFMRNLAFERAHNPDVTIRREGTGISIMLSYQAVIELDPVQHTSGRLKGTVARTNNGLPWSVHTRSQSTLRSPIITFGSQQHSAPTMKQMACMGIA